MKKPDHSLPENKDLDANASLATSSKAGGWYELAHWITGISSNSRPTFKDILDNFRNIATLLTISLVFTATYANGIEKSFVDVGFRVSVGGGFLILLSLLVLQSIALLHLSTKEKFIGSLSKAGMLAYLISFVDSVLVAVTAAKLFVWIFQL